MTLIALARPGGIEIGAVSFAQDRALYAFCQQIKIKSLLRLGEKKKCIYVLENFD